MPAAFHQLAFTGSVRKAQDHYYGRHWAVGEGEPQPDALTADEVAFIESRDSFYMATVGEGGWPYVQHRGGEPGFLKAVGPSTLLFADFAGNRQMISVGNLAASEKVALFLMDYPSRSRLKILGRARVEDLRDHPDLLPPEQRQGVERLFFIDVAAYDWNCTKHITPRYTQAEVEEAVLPLRQRIAELEQRLASLSAPNPNPPSPPAP